MKITLKEPGLVWEYFNRITQIPRPSKKEAKIQAFISEFAKEKGLFCKRDDAGNLLIKASATAGYEDHEGIILQAHMDMVCEKNPASSHRFETDPIETYIDGDWIKANGTTLGADNGIGMAMMLAVLASDDISHPALECLFTVDEETGLTGAMSLDKNFLTFKKLINLDSEDDGEVYIGCAGGIGTKAQLQITREAIPEGYFGVRVQVNGLKGGHSGGDIHLGLGNSIKILSAYLHTLSREMDIRISNIDGGNLHNAIPREAMAIFAVPYSCKERIRVLLNIHIAETEIKTGEVDPGFSMSLESEDHPETALNPHDSQMLINLLNAAPHGVIAMSKDIDGLVETSTNLASIKFTSPNEIIINTSQRSSSANAIRELAGSMYSLFSLAGAEVIQTDGYPGWKPNVQSALLQTTKDAYQQLFGEQPAVKAIHAGLECGLFLEKYPHLDMVSIGPQMYGVHSPDERLSISSTQKTWEWLKIMLQNL